MVEIGVRELQILIDLASRAAKSPGEAFALEIIVEGLNQAAKANAEQMPKTAKDKR